MTSDAKETQGLGGILAKELRGGEIICLTGELGSGKTTFTQGLLKGLRIPGPHTSPTFNIMKCYKNGKIYHCDAYRVNEKDILDLGWEEMIDHHGGKKNIIIVEWADRIKRIVPKRSIWVEFQWVDENRRKISFKSK